MSQLPVLPDSLADSAVFTERGIKKEPTSPADITCNNFNQMVSFVNAHPDVDLYFFPAAYVDGDHQPLIGWRKGSTNNLDELASFADLACNYKPNFHPTEKKANGKALITGYRRAPRGGRAVYFCVDFDRSGLNLVDIDDKTDENLGSATVQKLKKNDQTFPRTFSVATPTDGRHLYYKGSPLPHNTNFFGDNIDCPAMAPAPDQFVVGKGGYKTMHTEGVVEPIVAAPLWFGIKAKMAKPDKQEDVEAYEIEADTKDIVKRARKYLSHCAVLTQGTRNKTIYRLALRLRDFGVSKVEAINHLEKELIARSPEAADWSEAETEKTVNSAYEHAEKPFGCESAEYQSNMMATAFGVSEDDDDPRKALEFPFLSPRAKTPRPIMVADNLQVLMDGYGITVRYNQMKYRPEYTFPFDVPSEVSEDVIKALLYDLASRHDFLALNGISNLIPLLAVRETYHPVRVWLRGEGEHPDRWDKVPRVQAFVDSVVCEDDYPLALKECILKRWLCSAIAALYEPDFNTRGVLCLIGDENIGKTHFFLQLAPRGCVYEAATLDPNCKDSKLACLSYWLTELGEVLTTFKRDLPAIKAFLTSRTNDIRKPYGHNSAVMDRQTVFGATENQAQYLKEDADNTRFMTVFVKKFVYMPADFDFRQMWLEVKETMYAKGYDWKLNKEEMLELIQVNREAVAPDPVKELILSVFDKSIPVDQRTERLTATEVLTIAGRKPSRADLLTASACLKRVFGTRLRDRKKGWVYAMPPAFADAKDLT